MVDAVGIILSVVILVSILTLAGILGLVVYGLVVVCCLLTNGAEAQMGQVNPVGRHHRGQARPYNGRYHGQQKARAREHQSREAEADEEAEVR